MVQQAGMGTGPLQVARCAPAQMREEALRIETYLRASAVIRLHCLSAPSLRGAIRDCLGREARCSHPTMAELQQFCQGWAARSIFDIAFATDT